MKVAIIGCGGMGRLHAQMASRCGLTVAVCADTARKAAVSVAAPYGARVMVDPMAAARDKAADIVVITTPTPMHEPLTLAAAKAGKHIFCEKPFARTVSQCRRAIAAADKAGIKLFVGHVVRYFHEFECLRLKIQDGTIGGAGWAKLSRGGIYPGGPKSWFRDYAQSGGVTFDCMIHDLDWIRYVFGEPQRIFCQTLMRSKPTQLDYSQVTMRMRNGLIATVIGTWAHPSGFRVKVEVCGSAGMLQFDSQDVPLSTQPRETEAGPTMFVPASPVAVSPYQLEWEDFLRWLQTDAPPKVTPHDALRAVEMAAGALESAAKRQPVLL